MASTFQRSIALTHQADRCTSRLQFTPLSALLFPFPPSPSISVWYRVAVNQYQNVFPHSDLRPERKGRVLSASRSHPHTGYQAESRYLFSLSFSVLIGTTSLPPLSNGSSLSSSNKKRKAPMLLPVSPVKASTTYISDTTTFTVSFLLPQSRPRRSLLGN